jgi:proline dehydrogenase
MGIFDKAVASSLKFIPKPLVRQVARKYIAGENVADAVEVTRKLNAAGCMVTMDRLGEAVERREEADASADGYIGLLETIDEQHLDANVSIKPTHFGLAISRDLFEANVRRVIERARELGNFVRLDMEDSPTTDDTLAIYRKLRGDGLDNTGVVLQARLHRTPDDQKALADLSPSIRLCKGVYLEAEENAWQSYEDINRAFLALLEYALPRREYYIGIATHDDPIIDGAEKLIEEHGLTPDQYEFQMLLGVRPEVRKGLVARGHRVRVYVPFGTAWYAYCVRRLKENPKFAGYITKDLLRDPTQLFGKAPES